MHVILCRDRPGRPAQELREEEWAQALCGALREPVLRIPPLYDLSPEGPGVQALQGCTGDLVVLGWLSPRAAHWILDGLGIRGRPGRTSTLSAGNLEQPAAVGDPAADGADRTLWCLDLRNFPQPQPLIEQILAILRTGPARSRPLDANGQAPRPLQEVQEATRSRWYPVVDRSRCDNCLECLNFCLFGVFGLDEQERIWIEQPDACRPGCPACARVCPRGAILFPQHQDPAIAGTFAASAAGAAEQAAAERTAAWAGRERDLERLLDQLDHWPL